MKNNLVHTALAVYLAAAVLMLLPGCGGSTDPLQDYKDLRVEQVTDVQSENQTKPQDSYFDLTIGSEKGSAIANFSKGKDGSVEMIVTPRDPKIISYSVELINFTHQSQPTIQGTEKANTFRLSWKPPQNLSEDSKTHTATLLIKTTAAKDTRLIGMGNQIPVTIHVSSDQTKPTILSYTKIDGTTIDEGQKVPFVVEIKDPSSELNPAFPDAIISSFRYSNTEAFVADGRNMIVIDPNKKPNVEKTGVDTWKIYYVLDVNHLPPHQDRTGKVDLTATTVKVCFYVRAMGSNTVISDNQSQVCFIGRYSAQAPTIEWDESSLKDIKSGVESYLKFTLKSANGLGKTVLKNTSAILASLNGNKEIKCEDSWSQNPGGQNCTLIWKPLCSRTTVTKKLSLKVETTVNEKAKSQNFEKEVTVLANEELCPAVQPRSTTPSAKKGVVR